MSVSSEKQNKSHLPALEVIFYTVITDYQNNTVAYIMFQFNLFQFNSSEIWLQVWL